MHLRLAERLVPYSVTQPPLGRCTRLPGALLTAWGVDGDLGARSVGDGIVVDLTS
ncbi:MAG TPA: hypothetical protein VK866_07085 [Acidimicrobiales bacterium]|nr:hypothetical protein [Acidimicrobiales bacterium]